MGILHLPYLNIVSAESEEEFLQSGKQRVSRIISEIESYDDSFSIENADVLEIGTGPGRLIANFGQYTSSIYGVDISAYNLKKAKEICDGQGIDPILEQSEKGLPGFETEFDLIYSVIAFQHMKRRSVITYLIDSYESLKPGGIVYFTFANLHDDENFETLVTGGLEKTYSFRMRYFTEDELNIYFENLGYKDVQIIDDGHQLIAIARRGDD